MRHRQHLCGGGTPGRGGEDKLRHLKAGAVRVSHLPLSEDRRRAREMPVFQKAASGMMDVHKTTHSI